MQPSGEEPLKSINQMSVMVNLGAIDYCRTSAAVASGAAAGIIGLTGLYGFAFYFAVAIFLSVVLLYQAGSKWNTYFLSRSHLLTNGLFGGLFTYVLFWTFLYGMVHVY